MFKGIKKKNRKHTFFLSHREKTQFIMNLISFLETELFPNNLSHRLFLIYLNSQKASSGCMTSTCEAPLCQDAHLSVFLLQYHHNKFLYNKKTAAIHTVLETGRGGPVREGGGAGGTEA